jgi:hypothetical protein
MMKRLRADGDMQPNGDLVGYALALQSARIDLSQKDGLPDPAVRRAFGGSGHRQQHNAPEAVRNCSPVEILRPVRGTSGKETPAGLPSAGALWCAGWDK